MAFRPVTLTKEEEASVGANFFKFSSIGQKLLGRYLRTQPQTGPYARAGHLDYVFRIRTDDEAISEVVFSPPVRAMQLLEKAVKAGMLKPNYAVKITYVSDLDVGKAQPMKNFALEIDDAPTAPAARPPPPPPSPRSDDDIPF